MDDASDAKWLTFAELALARGISEPSARKLVRRHKWRRQAGNQGIVRILVPAEALDRPKDDPGTDLTHDPRSDPSDEPRAIVALEAAITALREQLEQANSRADLAERGRDRADQALTAERARADRAEQGRDGERARADGLRDRLTTMQEQLADAHAALQAAESAGTRAERAEQGKERAETSLAAERARADALRERIEALQVQLTARQEVIDAAEATRRAEDERRALGLMARLRAAWRGE